MNLTLTTDRQGNIHRRQCQFRTPDNYRVKNLKMPFKHSQSYTPSYFLPTDGRAKRKRKQKKEPKKSKDKEKP
jgi:hypothetical protein